MVRHLTKETKLAIRADNRLMADYADLLKVSIFSLPTLFERNSRTLTQHDALCFLAERLHKNIDDILTEYELNSGSKAKVTA